MNNNEKEPKNNHLIAPVHVNNASKAEAVAKHYTNLYRAQTQSAYETLGTQAEVKPKINKTKDGGADISFVVTTSTKK